MFKPGILIRWLILTAAIMSASYLLDGIQVSGFLTALLAAAILGFLNVFFRPILLILTLPLNIFTLGLFTFVINAFLLMMVSGVIQGFSVKDFWAALWGSLIISVVNAVLSLFVSDKKVHHKSGSVIDMKKSGRDKWE